MILSLIVKNKLPLKFIEYADFKKLVSYLYPNCSPISRGTLLNDIHKLFKQEKIKIKEVIQNCVGRISFTVDLWTSIDNDRNCFLLQTIIQPPMILLLLT
ncbi:hypothetical protein Droror1_Dr00026562 [Drosera rotundifolia]